MHECSRWQHLHAHHSCKHGGSPSLTTHRKRCATCQACPSGPETSNTYSVKLLLPVPCCPTWSPTTVTTRLGPEDEPASLTWLGVRLWKRRRLYSSAGLACSTSCMSCVHGQVSMQSSLSLAGLRDIKWWNGDGEYKLCPMGCAWPSLIRRG